MFLLLSVVGFGHCQSLSLGYWGCNRPGPGPLPHARFSLTLKLATARIKLDPLTN
jgi:hypothetical protein